MLDTKSHEMAAIDTPYTWLSGIRGAEGSAVFLAGSPTEPLSIARLDVASGKIEVLRRSNENELHARHISVHETVEFPTAQGRTAHAFFYRPKSPQFRAPSGEKPPLIVRCHGGPTGAATGMLSLVIQYWTSRGFAVLDVNYGGSTGYGRAYRERLKGNWGVVDVEDSVNGARYLVLRGEVDEQRLAITGGSAGGFTVLAALTSRDTFKAGASHFGISDLERLADDARSGHHHKFESRYEEGLIGPYPADKEVYRARSPIHHASRLACPVIFFQGLDDRVVLPNQAERMVEVLRQKRMPVAYLSFAGEGHGFRRAENIKRVLEAELSFYSQVFRFQLAEKIEPVLIDNLEES
jgi:dipeptidyl aminopeptidase/acylaminoacyl peptidase